MKSISASGMMRSRYIKLLNLFGFSATTTGGLFNFYSSSLSFASSDSSFTISFIAQSSIVKL